MSRVVLQSFFALVASVLLSLPLAHAQDAGRQVVISENGDYYEGAFRSDMEKSRLTRQKLWTRYREMLVAEPVRTGKVFRGTYSGSSGQADSSREFLVGRPVEPPCGQF